MSLPRTIGVRVSIGICTIISGWILGVAPAAGQPSVGGYGEDQLPACTVESWPPAKYLPVPDDPTAYVVCDQPGAPGRLEHCGLEGFTFNQAEQACMWPGDPATISVDSIAHQPTDPPTTVTVGVTYSGYNLQQITLFVRDPADVDQKNALASTPPGSLTSDNQPYSVVIPADSHNYTSPLPPFPGFWEPQPGEQIQVDARLLHFQPDPNLAPLLAATTTRTLAMPGPPPTPTNWSGSWSSGGMTLPATLTLDSVDSLNGTFEVQGLCSARWTQTQRDPDGSRVVNAHVVSGVRCADNQWDVTVQQNSITGYDTRNAYTTFSLTPE
jgi:hypothetical protein